MTDEKPDQPDLLLPDGWFAWENGTFNAPQWHARPPGTPDPYTYVHGTSKQEVCDKAWKVHRSRSSVRKARKP